MRHVIIGFTAKTGNKELSSVKGYVLNDDCPLHSHDKIRKDSLDWANRDGGSFSYFKINFINFVSEDDYNSFMGVSST